MNSLNHIKKLFHYLESRRIDDDNYITLESSRSIFLTGNDTRKDKAYVTLAWKKGGEIAIQISSWNESHHNGDPYSTSEREVVLAPPFTDNYENFGDGTYGEGSSIQKAIAAVEMDLETQAMEKARQEYNEKKQEEENALVKDFLFNKLGY